MAIKLHQRRVTREYLGVLNESYEERDISTVQRGVITRKPKREKDRKWLGKWRPITVHKIILTDIPNRLRSVFDSMISTEQKGFVWRRYTGEMQGWSMIDYTVLPQNMPLSLIIGKSWKGFGTVSRTLIFYCLQLFGYGQLFVRWIEPMYGYLSVRILQNGNLTKFLPMPRGCRQALLLLVSFSSLKLKFSMWQNDLIKKRKFNGKEYKRGWYADVTEYFLDETQESLATTTETMKHCNSALRLKVNINIYWYRLVL